MSSSHPRFHGRLPRAVRRPVNVTPLPAVHLYTDSQRNAIGELPAAWLFNCDVPIGQIPIYECYTLRPLQ
jgi:hypothetical protein